MSLPSPPRKFSTNQTNFATPVANDLWRHAVQMAEYINESYPLGMLIFVYKSQPGMPSNSPDPAYWHYMDGSTISNAASPFNGMTFPDLRGKFIRPRCDFIGEAQGSTGGSDTHNFDHNHFGLTGSSTDVGVSRTTDFGGSGSPIGSSIGFHQHPLSYQGINVAYNPAAPNSTTGQSDWSAVSIVPPTIELQVYMRIA